jgi:hypothetical protein
MGTYLGVELELDHVSGRSLDVVGVECERPIRPSDLDSVCHQAHGRHPRCRRARARCGAGRRCFRCQGLGGRDGHGLSGRKAHEGGYDERFGEHVC